jgi:hypothetical protein
MGTCGDFAGKQAYNDSMKVEKKHMNVEEARISSKAGKPLTGLMRKPRDMQIIRRDERRGGAD